MMADGSAGPFVTTNLVFAAILDDDTVTSLYPLPSGLVGQNEIFRRAVDSGLVTGKGHEVNLVSQPGCDKLLVVNVGKRSELTRDDLRMAAGYACGWLRNHTKLPRQVTLLVSDPQHWLFGNDCQLIVEGWELRNDTVARSEEARQAEADAHLNFSGPIASADEVSFQFGYGKLIGRLTRWVRRIGNLRASEASPRQLAEKVVELLKPLGVRFPCGRMLDEAFYVEQRFGAFLSVAKGAKERPYGVLARYNCGNRKAKTLAIVGKGVAFDTGGFLRKPGAKAMNDMYLDDLGAETATALFAYLVECGVPFHIVLMVNFTHNMDGTFPSDIITARNGQLIEVNHTDAEGRLLLDDGNDFVVERFKPTIVLDIATLTGAAVAALGGRVAMFSSDKADQTMSALYQAIAESGIGFWPMPMPFDQAELLKSAEADLVNTDLTNTYGAGTAALFLALALEATNRRCGTHTVLWHMDIAGKMKVEKPKGYQLAGADPTALIGLAYGLLEVGQPGGLLVK